MALDTDKYQVMNAISSLGYKVFKNGSLIDEFHLYYEAKVIV